MSTASKVEAFLIARGHKKQGQALRGPSPFRADSDGTAFSVTIDGPENGAYHDFKSGESGSLYELADKLGIERDSSAVVEVASTRRKYEDAEDYARAHGVDYETFKRAGWIASVFGQGERRRPALAFATQNGTRYRFLDGEAPPFFSPPGYKSCWYGLARAAEKARQQNVPLVLTNGEASTVVGDAYGLAVACVTSSGERPLSEDLLRELRDTYSGRIAIVFDCDDKGREASQALAKQLRGAGYSVAIVDLGLSDKGDLCDFLRLFSDRARACEALYERMTFAAPDEATDPSSVSTKTLVRRSRSLRARIRSGDARLYLTTGVRQWDTALGGGMWGELNYVAGVTGSGKSTLLASLVGLWTQRNLRGYIVTTEMRPDDWLARITAYMTRINSREVMLGSYPQALDEFVIDAEDKLCDVDHIWCETPMPSAEQLKPTLLRLVANKHIDFVAIDSASNMEATKVAGTVFDQTKGVSRQLLALARECSTLAGRDKPIPFIVTTQANARAVADKRVKFATMLDNFGGQPMAHDAVTYTTINYPHWFIARNLAEPDEDWPENAAALIVDKVRFAAIASHEPIRVRYDAGIGFFDTNVPPASSSRKKSKRNPFPTPTLDQTVEADFERVSDIEF